VPIPRTTAPTVVSLHDVQHHDLPELFSSAERRYRAWAYDGAARSATRVVTQSHFVKETLVSRVGVDPSRVDVTSRGIDLSRFKPEPQPADEALLAPLDLPDRFVFYPANLWPHKNHARLLEAFAGVSDPSLHLLLSGASYGKHDEITSRARMRGVGDRVRHLGFLKTGTLPAVYRRALALVFPSRYEGFGTPPLEAMACGCPVASSMRASLAETAGDAALAFEPESVEAIRESIERVTGDERLRAELAARGLERVKAPELTWEHAAHAHTAAYRKALA
jgi:glycosyltransferase involved in cell wall biosynthesis